MPEALLTVLKLCCLALIYLFFLRVLRAVWAEVNAPPVAAPAGAAASAAAPAPAPRRSKRRGKSPATHLVVVAPASAKGRSYELGGDELTVGRAAGCTVPLSDDYASSVHARVFRRDGSLYVEDLGSTNGTFLNDRKVSGPMAVQRGDQVKIGNTVLEVAG